MQLLVWFTPTNSSYRVAREVFGVWEKAIPRLNIPAKYLLVYLFTDKARLVLARQDINIPSAPRWYSFCEASHVKLFHKWVVVRFEPMSFFKPY